MANSATAIPKTIWVSRDSKKSMVSTSPGEPTARINYRTQNTEQGSWQGKWVKNLKWEYRSLRGGGGGKWIFCGLIWSDVCWQAGLRWIRCTYRKIHSVNRAYALRGLEVPHWTTRWCIRQDHRQISPTYARCTVLGRWDRPLQLHAHVSFSRVYPGAANPAVLFIYL